MRGLESLMFNREVNIANRRIIIRLTRQVFAGQAADYFFGYPIHHSLNTINCSNIESTINTVKGSFIYVGIENNRVIIANDISGAIRLYICECDGATYFSDDYAYLVGLLRERGNPTINRNEFTYWHKHGYTTGGATYVAGLRKLEPATIIEITASGLNNACYFQDIANAPDAKAHTDVCLQDLRDTLAGLASSDKEIILFFSGGVDSTLLALMLKDLRRDFVPVCIRSQPPYRDNYESHVRAQAMARYLGLRLEEIEVDLEEAFAEMPAIARLMPFDRHPAMLHFSALRHTAKHHGTDILVLNGQGADSVLSFGPSGRGKGDFAARVLMYRPYGFLAKTAGRMVGWKFGSHLQIPKDPDEYLTAFFDPFQYYTVLSRNDAGPYRDYIETVVERLCRRWQSRSSLLMYLKLYGFLQGADNQVVFESALYAGVFSVVMPYMSSGFIYGTIRHKDETKELLQPKYVIRKGIKSFGARLPKLPGDLHRRRFEESAEFFARADRDYYDEISRIIEEGEPTASLTATRDWMRNCND